MLVTGTTILTLFRTVWKPVKKTKESIENAMIAGADRRRNAAIAVELGEGYPELSVPLDGEEEPGGDGELADKLAALQKTAADMADAEKASPRVEDLLTKKGPVKGLETPEEASGGGEPEKKVEKKRPAYMDLSLIHISVLLCS